MLVAAEPSGDALGAGLVAALRRRLGDEARFVGVGGPLMAAEGVESPFDIAALSVLGVSDALRAWPLVRRRARETAAIAAREKPDIAVLIDSWGFSLRVAHRLRQMNPGLYLFKYVAPQVWATRPGRARTLARSVDHLLTIHAFDAGYFEKEGLSTTFVGNPVLAKDVAGTVSSRPRHAIGAPKDGPLLVVAPGSRKGEIDRLLPPFEKAVGLLRRDRPELRVVVAAADAVVVRVREQVARWEPGVDVVEGEAARLDAMLTATIALACSGTVTTELALCGTPMVVAYRLGRLTHAIVRLLIRTPYITLFNVAAGRDVAPEMIQNDCTGPALARELGRLLDNPAATAMQIEAQSAALDIMRGGIDDPLAAAADVIVRQLAAAVR